MYLYNKKDTGIISVSFSLTEPKGIKLRLTWTFTCRDILIDKEEDTGEH